MAATDFAKSVIRFGIVTVCLIVLLYRAYVVHVVDFAAGYNIVAR